MQTLKFWHWECNTGGLFYYSPLGTALAQGILTEYGQDRLGLLWLQWNSEVDG